MSFQQGLSGLNATSKHLEVIGNNIANANTFGAKTARAEFADVYAASLSGAGANTVGIGTNVAAVAQQFTQGNITTTQNPMDLAINGAGFFQVTSGNGPVSYTRNGQFKVDRDGFIVNNNKQRLMGYPANANGVIVPGQSGAIQLPTGGISPAATSEIVMGGYLNSEEAVTLPAAPPMLSFSNVDTYNRATSQTVFDSKGQEVALVYYFQKTAQNEWNVYATANGTSLAGTNAAPAPMATLQFAADGGRLISPVGGAVTVNVPATTSPDGVLTNPIPGLSMNFNGMEEYGGLWGITDMRQNGYAAGQLSSIAIESNGVIMARYSNGQSKPAGQLEVATFRNPQGLQPLGDNQWAMSYASGDPVVGVPGDGNLGVLQSGALEESNIDLTGELVSMITAQRIYQANAQTIKTQDQVLQTLVNLR
jgi:flagellar hook protein FlgE